MSLIRKVYFILFLKKVIVDLKRNLVYSKLFCFSEYCVMEKKYSIYQQIGISITLMCAIYVLSPFEKTIKNRKNALQ